MPAKLFALLCLTLLGCNGMCAQENLEDRNIFIRVYDGSGFLFTSGKLLAADDTSLTLQHRKKSILVDISQIERLKTKREFGHNVAMGLLIGAGAGLLYGFAQGSDGGLGNSGGENALIFGSVGLLTGTAVGSLSALGKKARTFEIRKDPANLQSFREAIRAQD